MTITPPPSLPARDGAELLSGWRYLAVLWSVFLAVASYLGFAFWSGWQDIVHAVGKVGFLGVATALSLSLINYCFRFIRWQIYLQAMNHPIPWWPSLKIYLAGFALTTTPGKAGEALRGVLLKPWGIPYSKSLAAFLSERLSDLLAVVLLALFGLLVYPAAQPLIAVTAICVLATLLILANQGLLERLHAVIQGRSRMRTLLGYLFQILLQARHCHAPAVLLRATGLSLIAWTAEAWAFYLILRWMEIEISLTFAVFIYAASMLAGALSFMPGGLGGAEAVMVALLLWKGAGNAEAIAATVLIRMSTLWFAVGIGVFFYFLMRRPIKL